MDKIKKYKSAYVLGKFLPFHLGHKYLIDTAIRNSEKVTVLVGTMDSEPIPGKVRYKWVKKTYKENKNVSVKWCNKKLPQYPEEDINFWNIWVKIARKYCTDVDVIFTSEKYGDTYAEKLGIDHFLVDINRDKFPICGTNIRNNPFKYWDFISDAAKKFFTKKIVIMGPESTGKSILTDKLATHYKTNFVEEYGRTVYEENGNKVSIDDFVKISKGRQKIENKRIKKSNKILFCDTEDITTYYLMKEFYPKKYKKNEKFLKKKIKKSKYDLYILLKPDCDGVQDGTRSFLDKRKKHFNIIKSFMMKKGCFFIEIGGKWDNRFNKSVNFINKNIIKNEINKDSSI